MEINVEFCESKMNNIGERNDKFQAELSKHKLKDKNNYIETHHQQITENSHAVTPARSSTASLSDLGSHYFMICC